MAVLNRNDVRYNKLMIRGPFGTGKSILLQQKAIQLNEQPQYKGKVAYLIWKFSAMESLLYHRMKFDLEENHAIFVVRVNYSTVSTKLFPQLSYAKRVVLSEWYYFEIINYHET